MLSLQPIRARMREQLDAVAPAPAVPAGDDFDLFDDDDPDAVRILTAMQRREDFASMLLQGALFALDATGHTNQVQGVAFLASVGRAEWWITHTGPEAAEA